VHARTVNRDVFIIILRRKHIPPLMENYQDFVFILYGPYGFQSMKDNVRKYNFVQEEKQG
jgi:hypothetical protein